MVSKTVSQNNKDLILRGDLVRLMVKLSIPSILGVFVLTLNTFIDALFAGRFISETALAGISLALPFVAIVQGLSDFVGIGSASILSRAIGAKNVKTQSKIFSNLLIIGVAISLLVTMIGYGFSKELIESMGGSGAVSVGGTEYLRIYTIGSIFFVLGKALGKVISSEGNIRWTTMSMWVFVAVNIFLNYIFIVIYDGETAEIALATVIAMMVASTINLAYFIFGKSLIPINLRKLAIAKELLPGMFSVGSASIFYPVMMLVQQFVVFNSIAYYGTDNDIAFFGATVKIISLIFIPAIGISQALQPVIGMNYGAKQYGRIKKAYLHFISSGIILLLFIWLPLQVFPKIFLNLILPGITFTQNDVINFRILSIFAPVSALTFFSINLFMSLGRGKKVLVLAVLRIMALNVSFVFLFSKLFAVQGIYLGLLFADIIFIAILFLLTNLEFSSLSKTKLKESSHKIV